MENIVSHHFRRAAHHLSALHFILNLTFTPMNRILQWRFIEGEMRMRNISAVYHHQQMNILYLTEDIWLNV